MGTRMKKWFAQLETKGVHTPAYLKQQITLITLTIISAGLSYWGTLSWVLPGTILLIGSLILLTNHYQLVKSAELATRFLQTSFISFLGILLVFLENRMNLFQALKESRHYVDQRMLGTLDQLLSSVEFDKSSEPFITMASHFKSQTITQILLLIYQLDQQGYDREIIARYQDMLNQIHADAVTSYIDGVNQRFNWYFVFPMIGTVLLTTFFALGVLEQVVETIYG